MQMQGTRYYRVNALAEMFDVSPATVYRAIRNGQLDAVRIGGSVRVPESALAGFVERAAAHAHSAYVMAGGSPEGDDAEGQVAGSGAGAGAGVVVGEVR